MEKNEGRCDDRLSNGRSRLAELHWYEAHGIGKKEFKRKLILTNERRAVKRPRRAPQFAVCIDNKEYPASLELHKIYRVLVDREAAQDGDVRVVDESGEDYLYPARNFLIIEVPKSVKQALLKAS